MVSLISKGKNPPVPIGKTGCPQSLYGYGSKEKNISACARNQMPIIQHVAILTELSKLIRTEQMNCTDLDEFCVWLWC